MMSISDIPEVTKAKKVKGKTLIFRDVTITDAAFIVALRTDSRKGKHLSKTSTELSQQITWLEEYATRIGQAYFIIENQEGEPLGTVRLYDPHGESFCWGSWILKEGAPKSAAIESALMVYAYAIDQLGFNQAHFDVRKGNEGVWRFHERFGAVRVGETEQDYHYILGEEQIAESRRRYKKYLSGSIQVEV